LEHHDRYSSPNVVLVTKSRRIRWVGYVACIGEKCTNGFDRKPEGMRHLDDLGVHGSIIFNESYKNRLEGHKPDSSGPG
jgi:hypothetical protein